MGFKVKKKYVLGWKKIYQKFPLVSIRGLAEGQVCADPGGRIPIGPSVNPVIKTKQKEVINIIINIKEFQTTQDRNAKLLFNSF